MMKKILMVLLCALASQIALAGSSERQLPGAFKSNAIGKNINYLLYTPPAYDTEPNRKFPLIVFLHGNGEKAWTESPMAPSDLNKLKVNGIPKMIAENRWPDSHPFIVLSTQCEVWCGSQSPQNIMQAINLIADKYRVDRSQIYITGLSMGAADANNFVNTYPDVPAAVVPIAGWGAANCTFPNVGWWGLHNEFDGVVGSGGTSNMGNFLKTCKNRVGVQTKTTIYTGSHGHDSWSKTYDLSAGQDVYAFMLAHRRGQVVPDPDPVNVAPKISAIAPMEIRLPDNRITINAQASDSDGYIASTLIENLSGGNAHIQDAASLRTDIFDLIEGNYEFKITVKDNLGATASTIVRVRVNGPTPIENPPSVDHYTQLGLAQSWNSMTIWGARPWTQVNVKSLGHTHFKLVVRRNAQVPQPASLKIRTGGGEHVLNFANETANGEFKEILLPLSSLNGDYSKFSHVYMTTSWYKEIKLDIAFMGFVGGQKDFVLISNTYSNIQSAMSPPSIVIK